MDVLGYQRFAVADHDTGMEIGYALAADHRDRVEALEVAGAVLPGVQASPPLFLPSALNERLFHLMFNHPPTMNAQLVSGREELFFGFIFDVKAGTQKLPSYAVRVYIDNLASVPGALLGSFYRSLDTTTAQNAQRATQKRPSRCWRSVARNPRVRARGRYEARRGQRAEPRHPGAGHWVAEQAPDQVLTALTAFLAPYRAAHTRQALS
jgi:pimeloyl-ACP methyl ester carboxylesterase